MKIKVENCRQIRIYPLIKHLLTEKSTSIQWQDDFIVNLTLKTEGSKMHIYFIYVSGNEEDKRFREYDVRLTKTKCHIAGWRYWFRCPLLSREDELCNNRIGVLYLPPGRNYFGCRKCHDLIYRRQCLSGLDKKYGEIISFPELQKEDYAIKKKIYAGGFTWRYMRHIERVGKNHERIQKRSADLFRQIKKSRAEQE